MNNDKVTKNYIYSFYNYKIVSKSVDTPSSPLTN